mmetsp:Transcript_61552/g.144227  ORF Transcript_61552/g.144227 Transcript_61552/m.144227 type:complete len:218 (-) Transcript_61552:413-1066(-)
MQHLFWPAALWKHGQRPLRITDEKALGEVALEADKPGATDVCGVQRDLVSERDAPSLAKADGGEVNGSLHLPGGVAADPAIRRHRQGHTAGSVGDVAAHIIGLPRERGKLQSPPRPRLNRQPTDSDVPAVLRVMGLRAGADDHTAALHEGVLEDVAPDGTLGREIPRGQADLQRLRSLQRLRRQVEAKCIDIGPQSFARLVRGVAVLSDLHRPPVVS